MSGCYKNAVRVMQESSVLLVSCIINYTKKLLKPHGLSDFLFKGFFLQHRKVENCTLIEKYFHFVLVIFKITFIMKVTELTSPLFLHAQPGGSFSL